MVGVLQTIEGLTFGNLHDPGAAIVELSDSYAHRYGLLLGVFTLTAALIAMRKHGRE